MLLPSFTSSCALGAKTCCIEPTITRFVCAPFTLAVSFNFGKAKTESMTVEITLTVNEFSYPSVRSNVTVSSPAETMQILRGLQSLFRRDHGLEVTLIHLLDLNCGLGDGCISRMDFLAFSPFSMLRHARITLAALRLALPFMLVAIYERGGIGLSARTGALHIRDQALYSLLS